MSQKKQHKFTCEGCKGTFLSDATEEELSEEYLQNFAVRLEDEDPDDVVELCDDCYNAVMEFERAEAQGMTTQ